MTLPNFTNNNNNTLTSPESVVDIHIYIASNEDWLESRHLANKNQIINNAISVGFLRVNPDTRIHNLRKEIISQLGNDVLPTNYTFLRSVGRNFTQVRNKQEHQLKVKNFVPPNAAEPEIYILETRDTGTKIDVSCLHPQQNNPIDRKSESEGIYSSPSSTPSSPPPFGPEIQDQSQLSEFDNKFKSSISEMMSKPSSEYYSDKEENNSVEDEPLASVTFVILEQEDGGGDNNQELEKELNEINRQRRDGERRRHVLIDKVEKLQRQLKVKREKNQHALRDQLVAAKKIGNSLEETCVGLRIELESTQRNINSNFDSRDIPIKMKDIPSKRANHKINAVKLQSEIKDLEEKIKSVHFRLEAETKLRSQAEKDVKQLRCDLSTTKASLTALKSRNSIFNLNQE